MSGYSPESITDIILLCNMDNYTVFLFRTFGNDSDLLLINTMQCYFSHLSIKQMHNDLSTINLTVSNKIVLAL